MKRTIEILILGRSLQFDASHWARGWALRIQRDAALLPDNIFNISPSQSLYFSTSLIPLLIIVL